MNITYEDITENLTHEDLAKSAISQGELREDETLLELGRELQKAVDQEADSAEIADKIKTHLFGDE